MILYHHFDKTRIFLNITQLQKMFKNKYKCNINAQCKRLQIYNIF